MYEWLYAEPPPQFIASINKFAQDGLTWDGIEKLLEFPAYDERTGAPNLIAVDHTLKDFGLAKFASSGFPQAILDKIAALDHDPDKLYVIGNAMGATETWGCFPAGTKVLMEDGSSRAIEAVRVGDKVRTHRGRSRAVERLWQRGHTLGLVRLRMTGVLPGPWMTPNHPVFAIPRDTFTAMKRRTVWKRKRQDRDKPYEVAHAALIASLPAVQERVAAESLQAGDMVALSFEVRTQTSPELSDPVLARLMGYYAADGCLSRKYPKSGKPPHVNGVVYVVGTEKAEVIEEILALARQRGHRVTPQPSNSSDKAVRLQICDRELGELCAKHVGSTAKKKKLSRAIKLMPSQWQLRFLGAYFNRDGNQQGASAGRYAGVLTVSSASRRLARDAQEVLWKNRVLASISGRWQTGGFGEGWIYSVSVGSSQTGPLLPHTIYKVPSREADNHSSFLMDYERGVAYLPVKAVEDRAWEGLVYNIQVEQDHSYVAGSLVVGNSNKNSDSFPRLGLQNDDPDTYGFATFAKHGHVFTHHQNKDKSKAVGKVDASIFDEVMDRIVLLYHVLRSKVPHIVDRLEKGESLDSSMGCKCPYDVCSLLTCKNKAKTRANYCTHLRDYPNRIMSNGEKVMAHTPHPWLFDQSLVAKGADPTAKTLSIVDTMAKKAWDNRPQHFVFDSNGLRGKVTADPNPLQKLAAPLFTPGGHPMGDPDAPRRASHEVDDYLKNAVNHIHPDDLRTHRRRFHKAGCAAPDGRDCICKEKTASLQEATSLEDFLRKAARRVEASITKEIPVMGSLAPKKKRDPSRDKVAAYARDVLPVLEAFEPDLTSEFLGKLARDNEPGEVLSSLLSQGIVLRDEEFRDLLGKYSWEDSPRDTRIGPAHVRRGVLAKISGDVLVARSSLPEPLYLRSLALVNALEKVSHQPQINPDQLMQLLQLMQSAQKVPGGSGNLVARGQQSYVPPSVQQQVMQDALLHMYRTNMGQIRPEAFDEMPSMSPFHGPTKTSSVTDFVAACRGVPTTAYLRYAHTKRAFDETETNWLAAPIPSDSAWFQDYVAAPNRRLDKVASLLAVQPGDVLDAASTVNLRFVRDALVGGR